MNTLPSSTCIRTTQGCRARVPWRLLGMLAAVVVLALIGVTIWGSRRYHRLLDLGKDAQQRVSQLNQSYAFDPQRAPLTSERVLAMLAIRDGGRRDLPPELNGLLREAHNAQSLQQLMGLSARLLQYAPVMETALDQLFQRLETAKMSPDEYQYLLGLAVHEALRQNNAAAGMGQGGPGAKAAAGYRELLARLSQISRADDNAANDFDAQQLPTQLERRYGDRSLPVRERVLAELDASTPELLMLDLMTVGTTSPRMSPGTGR